MFFPNFISMKYLIEIESDSPKGSEVLKYIEQLDAPKNDIRMIYEPPLTDEEMAMPPTRKVSRATLEAWLKPEDDEESFTIDEVWAMIKKDKKKNKLHQHESKSQ